MRDFIILLTPCMYREIYRNTDLKNNKKLSTSVDKLNKYIECHERNFGIIRMKYYSAKSHEKLSAALQNLKIAIEKDRIKKEEAYENLKHSNKIMRKTILKLREEMKTCRKDIHELQKLDDLNTDRLIQVDPFQYLR